MKFSIVTVSFNQAAFIERAILSVLEQDYPGLEYIIVDPGSSDGSRDIIERYRGRISKVLYKKDGGAAEGLNNGFADATGEIYGFLNADDLLLPGALARVARQFITDRNTEIVTGHMHVIDSYGNWLRNSYSDKYNPLAFAYGACIICQPSTFFRADLFTKAGGFNERNYASWDAELFLEMFQIARHPVLINVFLSAFRIHGASITGAARLRAEKRIFLRASFRRITGHPWRPIDDVIRFLYLGRKFLLEPRSALQRMLYGAVVGRYKNVKA